MLHHVFCGDCAADAARRHLTPRPSGPELTPRPSGPDATGPVHVWKDSSAVGPSSADPVKHRRLRSAWWNVDESQIQHPSNLPHDGELVLWFGPDPWEQIALLEVLAGVTTSPSLVPLACSVGELAPHDFAALPGLRRAVPDLARFASIWRSFCVDDRPALDIAIRALTDHPDLPHLAPALARVLADRRDHLTERRVRDLVAAGTRDIQPLMHALAALEAPHHGAWYGDVIVTRMRDAALVP